jgi:hypothetical protein
MAIIKSTIVEILERPGILFNKDIRTKSVKLDNYQAVHFYIATSDGSQEDLTVKIYGTKDGDNLTLIREHNLKIGVVESNEIVVVARELVHHELDSIHLEISNAKLPNKIATIFAVLTNERYAY